MCAGVCVGGNWCEGGGGQSHGRSRSRRWRARGDHWHWPRAGTLVTGTRGPADNLPSPPVLPPRPQIGVLLCWCLHVLDTKHSIEPLITLNDPNVVALYSLSSPYLFVDC